MFTMAPGSFASIALARSLSAERVEPRAVHNRHSVVAASFTTTIGVLNTSRVISKVVEQVHLRETVEAVQKAQRQNLTPTEQFEAMLTEELREMRRRETEKVARGVWW